MGGGGGGSGGRAVGVAIERGWVLAGDVAAANLCREQTKQHVIALFYQQKEEEEKGDRFSRFGEGQLALQLPPATGGGVCLCIYICVYVCECVCIHVYIYICIRRYIYREREGRPLKSF